MAKQVSYTIKDVARLAGVSQATVSHVVNQTRFVSEETRHRVQAAVVELQYQPSAIARGLKTKSTGTIAITVPNITNLFINAAVRCIEEIANTHGFNVIICNTDDVLAKEEHYLEVLIAKRIDGLLIAPIGKTSPAFEAMRAMGIPIVFFDRYIEGSDLPIVEVDNAGGVYQAICHLIQDGHRRIGFLSGPLIVSTSNQRTAGYLRALHEHGIPVDPLLIKRVASTSDAGCRATAELLAMPDPPTAIFAGNNLFTVGALLAIKDAGLVCPDQIGVFGFDDHEWAQAYVPPLSVVRQPVYELATAAAELLISLIRGTENSNVHRILPAEVVIRGSCAPHHDVLPPLPRTIGERETIAARR